jgi:hypothetical protein
MRQLVSLLLGGWHRANLLRSGNLPIVVAAGAIGLGLVPWSGAWPFTVSLGGALGQLLFGGGTLMGLLPMGLAPVWVLQLVCLILALPLYYFALGVSWRRYHQAGKALAAASGEVSTRTSAIVRWLRPRRSEEAAELRAERYEEALSWWRKGMFERPDLSWPLPEVDSLSPKLEPQCDLHICENLRDISEIRD